MKRFATLLLICLLLWPGAALAQGEDVLVVPAGRTEPGSIATVSQDIRVEGTVEGDVTSWSGSIIVLGTVGGDVVSYSGSVTIAPGAVVRGHALASGGGLQVAAGAAVAGQSIENSAGGGALASLLDLIMPGVDTGAFGGLGRALFAGTAGALLAAFCLLFIAFWPRRTRLAARTLMHAPARALALGALTTLLLALVLPPLGALLVASVVGVPLLLIGAALALALYAYGLAVLSQLLGGWLARRAGSKPGALPFLALLALVLPVMVVASLAPLAGALLFVALALPGVGAAILSRGGLQPLPEAGGRLA
jgi:hypothetical protein